MISNWRVLLAVGAGLCLLPLSGEAARDVGDPHLRAASDQLIVFEDDNCIYCRLFRRDVLPRYQRSPRMQTLPIHFVTVRHAEDLKQRLNGPLNVIPTFVVMRHGREIGRINGYTGPRPFFQLIQRIVGRAP